MGERRLILLRHAKSDWHSGAAKDFDRPLNIRGQRDAPRVGRWLQHNGIIPDVVCCSAALRTRQTLDLVKTELSMQAAECHFLDALYHAGEDTILALMNQYLPDQESGTLLVVGHNPDMEMALTALVPDVRVPADGKLMTTATVAIVDVPESAVPVLRHLIRPGML